MISGSYPDEPDKIAPLSPLRAFVESELSMYFVKNVADVKRRLPLLTRSEWLSANEYRTEPSPTRFEDAFARV